MRMFKGRHGGSGSTSSRKRFHISQKRVPTRVRAKVAEISKTLPAGVEMAVGTDAGCAVAQLGAQVEET